LGTHDTAPYLRGELWPVRHSDQIARLVVSREIGELEMHIAIRSALGVAAAVAVAGSANAADMPVKAPVTKAPPIVESWGGFYIGGGIGFRASETNIDVTRAVDTTAPAAVQNMFVNAGCLAGIPCVTGAALNGTAFRVSPYAGYNWQFGRFVGGIEGDAGFADQTTTLAGGPYPGTAFVAGNSPTNAFSVKTTWDASLRLRGGYLIDPAVLLYGTAGASWIHVETTSNCSTLLDAAGRCAAGGLPNLQPANITDSTTRVGYTVGGGIETMLWPNWIARAEYRFADYGRFSSTDLRNSAFGSQTVSYDTSLRTHTATFGLAYKFGNSAGPVSAMTAYAAVPEALSWTGFYVGAAAGVRANQTKGTLDQATIFPLGLPPINRLDGCACFLDNSFDTSSAKVSPYFGYNWQFNSKWVAGIEGDFGFANRTSTLFGNSLPGAARFAASNGLNDSFAVKTSWDASIRARLGYLVNPNTLIYLTGGAAWMKVEQSSRCDTAAQDVLAAPGFVVEEFGGCVPGLLAPAVITQSTVKPGFTIGAGGETKLWSNWILRGEYRYADYGRASFNTTRSCAGSATLVSAFGTTTINCFETDVATHSLRLQTHSAMFGIAYKFN
jgi:outer membrane immunogenic protein